MDVLKSEYFPRLYADFQTEKELVLVQEYISGQSLYQLIKSKGSKFGLTED